MTTLERLGRIVAECERLRLRPTSLKVSRIEFAHVRHHLPRRKHATGFLTTFQGVPLRVVSE